MICLANKKKAIRKIKLKTVKVDVSEMMCGICNVNFETLVMLIAHLVDDHKLDYDWQIDTHISQYGRALTRCVLR